MLENIHWTGHAGFKIKYNQVIYIDPFRIKETEPADLIIITHEHFDHLSPEDIRRILDKNTIIITTPNCASKLSGTVKTISPGKTVEIEGIKIEAVPAYNINKDFHPKSKSWIGVVITVGGMRVYHAGDTDNIPEMRNLRDIDVALLPVSGTYVMTAEEAAEAANTIMPKVAVPMHYGTIIGTRADAERFKRLCKCKVVLF